MGRERRGRCLGTAGPDGLVDVDMMRHGTLEARRLAETSLAHHPRQEGRRPGVAPARAGAVPPTPGGVLGVENPAALGSDCPVAGDGAGGAGRLGRAQSPRAAPGGPVLSGRLHDRLVHDGEPEERPLLHRQVDDPLSDLAHRRRAARSPADLHRAGRARDARRRRHDVEDVGRQPVECGLLRRSGRGGRHGEHQHERLNRHQHPCGISTSASRIDGNPVRILDQGAGLHQVGLAPTNRWGGRLTAATFLGFAADRSDAGIGGCGRSPACLVPPHLRAVA